MTDIKFEIIDKPELPVAPAAPTTLEPVAWLVYLPSIQTQNVYDDEDDPGMVDDLTNHEDAEVTALYAIPPDAAMQGKEGE